jgi:hypothetical protein
MQHATFLQLRTSILSSNLYVRRPPLVGCIHYIQYIHSYPPYHVAVSSKRRLRIHHAVAIRNPFNVESSNQYNLSLRQTFPPQQAEHIYRHGFVI